MRALENLSRALRGCDVKPVIVLIQDGALAALRFSNTRSLKYFINQQSDVNAVCMNYYRVASACSRNVGMVVSF